MYREIEDLLNCNSEINTSVSEKADYPSEAMLTDAKHSSSMSAGHSWEHDYLTQAQTHHSLNSVHGAKSQLSKTYPNLEVNIPWSDWQSEVHPDQVKAVMNRIISHWPKQIDPAIRRKCYTALDLLLRRSPDLRRLLLSGDATAIKMTADKTSPDKVISRMKGPQRDGIDGGRDKEAKRPQSGWLRGHLTTGEYDKIISHFMVYWKIKETSVISRLRFYSQTQGLITSPEPLLSDNEEEFKAAADLIYNKDRSKKARTNGPKFIGTYDVLHQPSMKFNNTSGGPFFIDYEHRHSVPSAQRNRSHDWHNGRHHSAIRFVHAAIIRQWVPWIDNQFITRRLHYVNEYLDKHREYIQRILDGDEEAAFKVARDTMHLDNMMRRYNPDYLKMVMQGGACIL